MAVTFDFLVAVTFDFRPISPSVGRWQAGELTNSPQLNNHPVMHSMTYVYVTTRVEQHDQRSLAASFAQGNNECLEETMIITNEQLDLARNGQVVRVSTDSGELVILNAATYDKIARLVTDDPRDAYQSVLSAWDAEGSPDDATIYQDLA